LAPDGLSERNTAGNWRAGATRDHSGLTTSGPLRVLRMQSTALTAALMLALLAHVTRQNQRLEEDHAHDVFAPSLVQPVWDHATERSWIHRGRDRDAVGESEFHNGEAAVRGTQQGTAPSQS